MKKFYVIAYDISDDSRRLKIAQMLERRGRKVNRSVFECFMGEKEYAELKKSLAQLVNKDEDIILYYRLCRECIGCIDRQGSIGQPEGVVRIV
ncbi:MAG: CRISPR-associated endonuclease Cas2 [Candidatus Moranbacteria bacterium]|nr:CRISPR-associated endonuclease Cas2 [Candidatus Moranbacteria bacterium]